MDRSPAAVLLALIVVLITAVVFLVGRLSRLSTLVKSVQTQYGITENAVTSSPRPGSLHTPQTDLGAPKTYADHLEDFNNVVERAFRYGDFKVPNGESLTNACKNALTGGKRVRPIILMEIARAVSKRRALTEMMPQVDPAEAALAIEYLHTASLVVDDLPAFDNDATRRGKPSTWASTTPRIALMAAFSMVSEAFQNICRQVDWLKEHCGEWVDANRVGVLLCRQVSQAMGILGAAGGQFLDTTPSTEVTIPQENHVTQLTKQKTAPFFEIAFVAGWLIGGGDPREVDQLRQAGEDFGVAFQIADDLGDLDQDRARKDAGKPGWNYADILGENVAEVELCTRIHRCRNVLEKHGLSNQVWEEIFGKVISMSLL